MVSALLQIIILILNGNSKKMREREKEIWPFFRFVTDVNLNKCLKQIKPPRISKLPSHISIMLTNANTHLE